MRTIKFRFWDCYAKQMIYNGYPHADCSFNGLLVCEGDTIPLQFTGLLDKNGKEIYEGDILKYTNPAHPLKIQLAHEVIWHPNASFLLKVGPDENQLVGMNGVRTNPERWTVIGNIYESPELIK